jgi:hypothetical protein
MFLFAVSFDFQATRPTASSSSAASGRIGANLLAPPSTTKEEEAKQGHRHDVVRSSDE